VSTTALASENSPVLAPKDRRVDLLRSHVEDELLKVVAQLGEFVWGAASELFRD
jgi:hypothetical protein